MNPKVEESRIRFALRSCERHGFKVYAASELVEEAADACAPASFEEWF